MQWVGGSDLALMCKRLLYRVETKPDGVGLRGQAFLVAPGWHSDECAHAKSKSCLGIYDLAYQQPQVNRQRGDCCREKCRLGRFPGTTIVLVYQLL